MSQSEAGGPIEGPPRVRAAAVGAAAAVVTGLVVGGAGYAISTFGLGVQAFGLFAYAPFAMGFATAFAHRRVHPRGNLAVPALIATVLPVPALFSLLIFGLEGIVCVLMAIPIISGFSTIGGVVGWLTAGAFRFPGRIAGGLLLPLALVPAVERVALPEPEPTEVRTSIVVDAPPEAVWRHVIRFPRIEEPVEGVFFRLGVPAPVEATLDADAEGGLRRCVFTEGVFEERVTVWQVARELTFDVERMPQGSEPYVHATIIRGRFRLEPLPDGRTRLIGSTWYVHDLRPRSYWDFCADRLLQSVHRRVLRHVKALAESSDPTGR